MLVLYDLPPGVDNWNWKDIFLAVDDIVVTSPRDANRQTLARNVSIMFLYVEVYIAQ